MPTWSKGDRVALRHAVSWTGTIERVRGERYDVALDAGGRAKSMHEDDLTNSQQDEAPESYDTEADIRQDAVRERRRSREDKKWPPSTMETKVPGASGAK